uniref:Uncharacterized protein n=1 Tax=viral metagenome TaxID=1070528 RepID=A0A6C0LM08_9ZZZZ
MLNYLFNLIYNNQKNDISYLSFIFFSIFFNNPGFVKYKFLFYKDTNENTFLNKAQKNNFNQAFSKLQFVYFALTKFVNIIKIKKQPFLNEEDFLLNPIDKLSKTSLVIYQNNSKNIFTVNDLTKIIKSSLLNVSFRFINKPVAIKNPYNNIPFNKSNLYNIYFFILFNTHFKVDLLQKFFLHDFDMTLFFKKHEYLLREYAIKEYVAKEYATNLYKGVLEMLIHFNSHNRRSQIIIHADFPKELLVGIMRPYLLLDLMALYSLIPDSKKYAAELLTKKLRELHTFNPTFGRKVVSFTPKCVNFTLKSKRVISFNSRHIKFNNNNDFFLSNHIAIEEERIIPASYVNTITVTELINGLALLTAHFEDDAAEIGDPEPDLEEGVESGEEEGADDVETDLEEGVDLEDLYNDISSDEDDANYVEVNDGPVPP